VFYEQRRNIYKYLGGLVGGAQEAFVQGSIKGWADDEWRIQMEEQQRLETQMTYSIYLYYFTAAHKSSSTIYEYITVNII